jgi:hypothetical protein
MIDAILLRVFVWIGQRWFDATMFGTDCENRTIALFFFVHKEQGQQLVELMEEAKQKKEQV